MLLLLLLLKDTYGTRQRASVNPQQKTFYRGGLVTIVLVGNCLLLEATPPDTAKNAN